MPPAWISLPRDPHGPDGLLLIVPLSPSSFVTPPPNCKNPIGLDVPKIASVLEGTLLLLLRSSVRVLPRRCIGLVGYRRGAMWQIGFGSSSEFALLLCLSLLLSSVLGLVVRRVVGVRHSTQRPLLRPLLRQCEPRSHGRHVTVVVVAASGRSQCTEVVAMTRRGAGCPRSCRCCCSSYYGQVTAVSTTVPTTTTTSRRIAAALLPLPSSAAYFQG